MDPLSAARQILSRQPVASRGGSGTGGSGTDGSGSGSAAASTSRGAAMEQSSGCSGAGPAVAAPPAAAAAGSAWVAFAQRPERLREEVEAGRWPSGLVVVDPNSAEGKALLAKRALHEAAASAEREKHIEAYLAPLVRKDELALKAEGVKMIKVKAWRCLECKYFHERALESCRQKHDPEPKPKPNRNRNLSPSPSPSRSPNLNPNPNLT